MKNKKGFTLAEIIISMTIIGVIAAITIPALLVNTSEKALEAQKKAFLARISQAMSQIEDLRVYEISDGTNDKSSAMNFVSKGLSKVYRIVRTCDAYSIEKECLFPEEITTQNGDTFNIKDNIKLNTYLANSGSGVALPELNTEVVGFKTANGESVALYYNPRCRGGRNNGYYSGSAATALCINMIYDLNGRGEAPNEVGKDIGFLTVFFPKDPDIVSPIPYAKDATVKGNLETDKYAAVISSCKAQNKSLIIPNWQEGMSMALNKQLINLSEAVYIVSGAGKIDGAYEVNVGDITSSTSSNWSGTYSLRCVYN